MASTETPEVVDLADVIMAYNEATERLKRSHDALCEEVARLRAELAQKNRMLQRKDRLAALGQMAAGMAHEIRNPLGGIQLYASLLERDLAERDDLLSLVRKIQTGTQTLNGIVSEMLSFTATPTPERRPVRLSPLIDRALDYARPKIQSGGIQVSTEVDDDLAVWADGPMIERAILNVILNAVEAMPQGGRVAVQAAPAPDGACVEIRIGDSGEGMDPAVQDKMFDPFFTTKDHGTGLGLAIVHRVVEAHDGHIGVDSVPGRGTTLVLSLPRHDKLGMGHGTIERAGAA